MIQTAIVHCRLAMTICMFLLFAATTCLCAESDKSHKKKKWNDHTQQNIKGWAIHVDMRLLDDEKELGNKALKVLAQELERVSQYIPNGRLEKLKKVPIWIDLDHSLRSMQYHPDVEWLEEHGYDPKMVKAVHIPNVNRFLNHKRDRPKVSVVLHELAHGFHNRVLGFGHAEIKKAYQAAVKSGNYDSVRHLNGRKRRHYGLTDPMEYFAEGTEAFFGTNDFYPFVREELKRHDPKLYHVLEEVWGTKK